MEKILYTNEKSGCADIVMDPKNSGIVCCNVAVSQETRLFHQVRREAGCMFATAVKAGPNRPAVHR
jgi:hypothetical protein